jgi:hypothetical protein
MNVKAARRASGGASGNGKSRVDLKFLKIAKPFP